MLMMVNVVATVDVAWQHVFMKNMAVEARSPCWQHFASRKDQVLHQGMPAYIPILYSRKMMYKDPIAENCIDAF